MGPPLRPVEGLLSVLTGVRHAARRLCRCAALLPSAGNCVSRNPASIVAHRCATLTGGMMLKVGVDTI